VSAYFLSARSEAARATSRRAPALVELLLGDEIALAQVCEPLEVRLRRGQVSVRLRLAPGELHRDDACQRRTLADRVAEVGRELRDATVDLQ